MSIVPGRSATCPSPASGSRKSAQQTVPGNHACHGATPRNPSPRGSPAAIALTPSRLSHLLFAQTQVSNSSVPTAAFVSLPPSSLLLGAALASGEQLVAHSSPGLGEGGGGLGSASPPSALRRRRSPRRKDSGHKASPEWLSPLERRRGEVRAPGLSRLTAARRLADRSTRPAHSPRPAPPGAEPRQELSPAHSAGPPSSSVSPHPSRSPAQSQPRPALPQGPAPPTPPGADTGSVAGVEGEAGAAPPPVPASPPRSGRGS